MKIFYQNLRQGYIKAGGMLLKNLPLTNVTIIRLAALDPAMYKASATAPALEELGKNLSNILTDDELGQLSMDAKGYSTDLDVSSMFADMKEDIRIDSDWWAKIFALKAPIVETESTQETEKPLPAQRYPHCPD